MTFEEVSGLLGHPEPIRTSNRRLVLELEDLMLGFHQRKLDVISIKFKNPKLHLPQEVFEQEINYEDWKKYEHFVKMLSKNNIKYNSRNWKNYQGMSCIELETDISFFLMGIICTLYQQCNSSFFGRLCRNYPTE